MDKRDCGLIVVMVISAMGLVFSGCAAVPVAQRVVIADAPCLPLLYTAAQCIWTNTKGALPAPLPVTPNP